MAWHLATTVYRIRLSLKIKNYNVNFKKRKIRFFAKFAVAGEA